MVARCKQRDWPCSPPMQCRKLVRKGTRACDANLNGSCSSRWQGLLADHAERRPSRREAALVAFTRFRRVAQLGCSGTRLGSRPCARVRSRRAARGQAWWPTRELVVAFAIAALWLQWDSDGKQRVVSRKGRKCFAKQPGAPTTACQGQER